MLPAARLAETEALVDALVRNVRSRQSMGRAMSEVGSDEAAHLPFVGSLGKHPGESASVTEGIESLRRVLGFDLDTLTVSPLRARVSNSDHTSVPSCAAACDREK